MLLPRLICERDLEHFKMIVYEQNKKKVSLSLALISNTRSNPENSHKGFHIKIHCLNSRFHFCHYFERFIHGYCGKQKSFFHPMCPITSRCVVLLAFPTMHNKLTIAAWCFLFILTTQPVLYLPSKNLVCIKIKELHT